jgi:hypothetical protein
MLKLLIVLGVQHKQLVRYFQIRKNAKTVFFEEMKEG